MPGATISRSGRRNAWKPPIPRSRISSPGRIRSRKRANDLRAEAGRAARSEPKCGGDQAVVGAVAGADVAFVDLPVAAGEDVVDAHEWRAGWPEALSGAREGVAEAESGRIEGILQIAPHRPVQIAVAGHVEVAGFGFGYTFPCTTERFW